MREMEMELERWIDGELSCNIIVSIDQLAELDELWNQLAESSSPPNPFATFAWVYPYLVAQSRRGIRWACVVTWRDDQLVGVLPVEFSQIGFGPVRCFYASVPYSHHLMGCEPVIDKLAPETVFYAMVDALNSFFQGRLMCLVVPELGARFTSDLESASPGRHYRSWLTPSRSSSVIDIPEYQEEFNQLLSKNARKNLKKAERKLENHCSSIEYKVTRGDSPNNSELLAFAKLEGSGWKGRIGTAIGQDQELLALYMHRVQLLTLYHMIEWHLLLVDGQRIAARMAVRFGDRLTIWKVAFDEEFSEYSPGMLLMVKIVQNEIGMQSSRSIDLVTSLPWHNIWKPSKDQRYRFIIVPKGSWQGQLALFYYRFRSKIRAVKPLLKKYSGRIWQRGIM